MRSFDVSKDEHPAQWLVQHLKPEIIDPFVTWFNEIVDGLSLLPNDVRMPVPRLMSEFLMKPQMCSCLHALLVHVGPSKFFVRCLQARFLSLFPWFASTWTCRWTDGLVWQTGSTPSET